VAQVSENYHDLTRSKKNENEDELLFYSFEKAYRKGNRGVDCQVSILCVCIYSKTVSTYAIIFF